jgi:hypothetical protein
LGQGILTYGYLWYQNRLSNMGNTPSLLPPPLPPHPVHPLRALVIYSGLVRHGGSVGDYFDQSLIAATPASKYNDNGCAIHALCAEPWWVRYHLTPTRLSYMMPPRHMPIIWYSFVARYISCFITFGFSFSQRSHLVACKLQSAFATPWL